MVHFLIDSFLRVLCALCGEKSKMKKISVAIITKNEEANIRDCLESVRWADDIVVVDSGSTDQTLKICGEFPVRVFGEEWKGFRPAEEQRHRQDPP